MYKMWQCTLNSDGVLVVDPFDSVYKMMPYYVAQYPLWLKMVGVSPHGHSHGLHSLTDT